MAEIVTRVERDRIRSELVAHREVYELTPGKIAGFINANSQRLKGTISADSIERFLDLSDGAVTVGDARVALLGRYLQFAKETWPPPEPSPAAVNAMFPALRAFFEMRPVKAGLFRDKITGVWAFYAYSEKGRSRVCRGAIAFTAAANGDLCAQELQQAVPVGSTDTFREEHSGHFLFRKNSMIVFLREKRQSLPKFYILSIEPYENDAGQYVVMTGTLLKIGAQQDVFSGRVRMVRDNTAFTNCNVVPASDVKDILDHLD